MTAAIRGQDAAIRSLRGAVRSGRVGGAYLFAGPLGVGKRTAARAFAAALLCEAPADGEACGRCRACGKVARGSQPDLLTVDVEEGKKEISVDQVRAEIVAHMKYSPYEARRRVVLISAADDLSASAANSLLKSMEEPGANTHFVLVSSEAHRLLPTIRSRCQEVRFAPLTDETVVEILVSRGTPEDDARRAALFAGGSVGRALQRLGGDLAGSVAAAERLDAASQRPLREILEAAASVAKERKESLGEVLEAWLLLWRRRMRASPEERAVRAMDAIHAAILALERNANPELTLDRALLDVAAAFPQGVRAERRSSLGMA